MPMHNGEFTWLLGLVHTPCHHSLHASLSLNPLSWGEEPLTNHCDFCLHRRAKCGLGSCVLPEFLHCLNLQVDLDLQRAKGRKDLRVEETVIKSYRASACVCEDVVEDFGQLAKIDAVQSVSYGDLSRPEKKTFFETRCPLSYAKGGGCPRDAKLAWHCARCQEQMEYGFDRNLYCGCGSTLLTDCRFRCAHPDHGEDFAAFPDEKSVAEACDGLKSFDGLTILVLGETGVGKSTFINGFANYMQFQTLVREKSELNSLSLNLPQFVSVHFDYTGASQGGRVPPQSRHVLLHGD